jgi:hypothetical protein
MATNPINVQAPRSIAAAVRHGRIGSAFAAAMVAVALIISIGAIVTMIGTAPAFAGPRDLITIDDGTGHGGISLVIAIAVIMLILCSVAFNGLTPGHARRRRERR